MPARKMRVELSDTEGNRYAISFEGQVTRDKAMKLLDLVELLGGMPSSGNSRVASEPTLNASLSKYEKMRSVVQKQFPAVWFSSREVQSIFEQVLKEPIGLSTVATYLARLTIKGIVLKTGTGNKLKYRLAPQIPQVIMKQETS